MGVSYIGFGPSTNLPARARVRVVFGEKYSLNPDGLFALYFPDALDNIQPIAGVVPVNRPAVPQGETAATVDGVSLAARTGGDLVSRLQDAAAGNFVEVRSVELLPSDAKITGDDAAAARDKASLASRAQAEADSIVHKIADRLGVTLTVAKWIAVVLALGLLAFLWHTVTGRE